MRRPFPSRGRRSRSWPRLSRSLRHELIRLATAAAPGEICGLVVAEGPRWTYRPIPNREEGPRYRMDPAVLAEALLGLRRRPGVRFAFVHSHPTGPPRPSPQDLRQALWPQPYWILGRREPGWALGAYRIQGGESVPVAIPLARALPRRWVRPRPSRPDAAFARHAALAEVGPEGEARLARASVLLVGLGGLGCATALYLASAGVGQLDLSDGDVVEASNLGRQVLYGPEDVGRPKAEAARAALRRLRPDLRGAVLPRLHPANAASLVAGHDLVVVGTDTVESRLAVNEACLDRAIPWVEASVERYTLQVTTFRPGGPCYRCLHPRLPGPEERADCAQVGVLGPAVGVAGTWQAAEALRLIWGLEGGLDGRVLVADLLRGTVRVYRAVRRSGCPACGRVSRVEAPAPPAAGPQAQARALGLTWPAHRLEQWPGPVVDLRAPGRALARPLPGALPLPGATPSEILRRFADGPPPLLVCEVGLRSALLALAVAPHLPGVRSLEGGVAALATPEPHA